MGSTAPNVPTIARLQAVGVESGQSTNLVCSAQGNPVPNSRYTPNTLF